ncbi:MAG: PAAR domain-containing protein [Polyangiaceae bacterium]
MPDAARVDDKHACPCPTPQAHVGGPIDNPASTNVETNSKGAARATDKLTCTPVNLKNFIVTGSTTVEINGKLAARKTDKTMHPGPGTIVEGSTNVEIGGATGGATLGNPDEAARRCQAAASGRTSGRTQQSYQNCGVESSRQLINQSGNPIGEDQLLNEAMNSGDADRVTTGKWPNRQTDMANSGGTGPDGRNNILNSHGVPAHTETQNMGNIQQAVAEGRGVITSHDAGILWGDPAYNGGGHAIVTTGLEYDENGNLKNVIMNDTGLGQCRRVIPASQFQNSLRPGRDINVTNNKIW